MWAWSPLAPAAAALPALVAPVGPAGVATLCLLPEDGARVTYTWQTDVIRSYSGREQRRAVLARPRQRYEFELLLDDARYREILTLLAGSAAAAPTFLLGLPYEAVLVAGASPTTIETHGLSLADWAAPGQRVIVLAADGATYDEAVVQAVGTETLAVDADVTTVAAPGALVMPGVPVLLEAEQSLDRHPVELGRWRLAARGTRVAYAGGAVGVGATVETFDGLPIWSAGNALDVAAQPALTGAALVDLGGALTSRGVLAVPEWGRALRIERGNDRGGWQWLKAFLHAIRGAQHRFLAPTYRPDLVAVGDASSGTLSVEPGYLASWYPSLAHRRIALRLAGGGTAYRRVLAVAAAGAVEELALDAPVSGAIERVEYLEQVRLEGDDVSVAWTGDGFAAELTARVVQQ